MAEFIVNPRRAPRAPARCRAAVVVSPAGAFDAETEDVGARGCQVVSPERVKKGDAVELLLSTDRFPDELRVSGTVAWVSEQPPWRVGIAFDEGHVPAGERWFEKLVAATPGLGSTRRVPERISLDAMVYLGPPPRFLHDFTAGEAELLRAIGSGTRLDELQARLRDRWPAAQRAFFSLLARQAVTLTRGQAAHPDAWKKILTEVEALLAVESLGSVAPTLVAPPEPARPDPTPLPVRALATPLPRAPTPVHGVAAPWGAPAVDPHPQLELADSGPALDPPQPRGASRADPGAGFTAPSATPASPEGMARSVEAQALYDRALGELQAGSVHGAITLLRQALAQAPGDSEIAATLGKLAFRDRTPRER